MKANASMESIDKITTAGREKCAALFGDEGTCKRLVRVYAGVGKSVQLAQMWLNLDHQLRHEMRSAALGYSQTLNLAARVSEEPDCTLFDDDASACDEITDELTGANSEAAASNENDTAGLNPGETAALLWWIHSNQRVTELECFGARYHSC